MQQIITLLHILVSICIVCLILIQRGKGADAGAGFSGGGSSTMFGSQGSTPFLVKLTGGLAIVFFITSTILSLIIGRQAPQHNPLPLPVNQTQEIPTSINAGESTAPKATPPLEGTTTQSPMPAQPDKAK
ncbi:MAG TPA: preprotein translocase subunit SecG [Gammaproteobacteria bacterium]|nr:preprotein translocase subunit SecG [Gammaproteobacteria bacterium]